MVRALVRGSIVCQKDAMRHRRQSPRFRALGGIELHYGRSNGGDFTPHFHNDCQIQLVTLGAFELRTVDGRYVVEPGMICALNPGQMHASIHLGDGWSSRAIYLPPSVMLKLFGERCQSYFSEPVIDDPALAAAMLLAHEQALAEGEPGVGQLLEQLKTLFERYARARAAPALPLRISRAVDFLNENYVVGASLAATAAAAGYSPFHFIRVFTRVTGLTPNDFQSSLRVAHAKRALRDRATSAQAALDAGYFDQSHLTKSLRRIHGLTPGALRRAFLEPPPRGANPAGS